MGGSGISGAALVYRTRRVRRGRDPAELEVTDASFAPTVQLPSVSATLDAATALAATLVSDLTALRRGA